MKTRITQEDAYEFVKRLPKEISLDKYAEYQQQTLHLRLTKDGLKFTFTDEPIEGSYHLEKFPVSNFYKGQDTKKRVQLKLGSMMLWTTVFQYMEQVGQESVLDDELPFNINKLRYIGTTDESEGVSNISSNHQLPYRLTHSFLDEKDIDVYYIEDVYVDEYTGRKQQKTSVYTNSNFYTLNYLDADKFSRLANWGQNIESELSKQIKEEQLLYEDYLADDGDLEDED